MERVGKCSVCGKDAAWNTPHIDEDNNLYCNRCAYDSTIMLTGINQYMKYGKYVVDSAGHYTKNHCTVCIKRGVYGWTDSGRYSYFMNDNTKEIAEKDPEFVIDTMILMRSLDMFRCSDCGMMMHRTDVASFPLFAGVLCKKCNVGYTQKIENERKTGHVCMRCIQPYSLCCC
jgi:hypothetical protein